MHLRINCMAPSQSYSSNFAQHVIKGKIDRGEDLSCKLFPLKNITLCHSNTQLQAFNSTMAKCAQNVTFILMIIDAKISHFTSFI